MYAVCNTAQRIRNIRMQSGLTQAQLAERCNVTKSLICKIEANRATIHLSLLIDIAKALGVTISELVGESPDKKMATVVKEADRKKWVKDTPGKLGYEYFRIGGSREARMEAFILLIKKEAESARFVEHDATEFLFILEGNMKLQFRGEEYMLRTGDTACFDARQGHRLLLCNCEMAQLLMLYVKN